MRGIAFDGWILRDSALWLRSPQSRKEEDEVTLASCWSARRAGALGLLGGNMPSSPAARAQRSLCRVPDTPEQHRLAAVAHVCSGISLHPGGGTLVPTEDLETLSEDQKTGEVQPLSDCLQHLIHMIQLHNVVRRMTLIQYESSHLMRKLHYSIKQ